MFNELKAIAKDEGVLLFFILLPIAYPLLYSWIYNNEVVREVPVAIVDDSHSALSCFVLIASGFIYKMFGS